jgi:hypothetical protein
MPNLNGTLIIPLNVGGVVDLARLNVPALGTLSRYSTGDFAVKWPASFGGATATGESTGTDVTTFSDEAADLATLPIGSIRIRSSFQVLETDFTQAMLRGQDALSNLIEYSSKGAQREILSKVGTVIFSGAGTTADGGVYGLETLYSTLDTGTGTSPVKTFSTNAYGAIDPATYPKWTNLVYDNTGSITRKKLRTFESDLLQGTTSGVPSNYTILYMSPATAGAYLDEFDAATTAMVNVNQGADLSYGRLSYNGRPVVEDIHVPDGVILFVNLPEVRLYSYNQAQEPGFSSEMPVEALYFYMKELPSSNPQMNKFAMWLMPQLVVRDRTAVSVMKGITVS